MVSKIKHILVSEAVVLTLLASIIETSLSAYLLASKNLWALVKPAEVSLLLLVDTSWVLGQIFWLARVLVF